MLSAAQVTTYLNQYDILKQLHYAPLASVTFLAQGEYNRNFLLTDEAQQKLVFRVNYGSQINVTQQARYEYTALQYLYPSQHTPKPLFLDDSKRFFEQDIMIETFLPGRPLIYHQDLHRAAEIFASIHNLPVPKAAATTLKSELALCQARILEADTLLKPVFDTPNLTKDQRQVLFQLRDWCAGHNGDAYFKDRRQCLVNTEVNANNFLITEDYGWLIDWEKPVISHPVQDLTQFMAETTTLWRTDERLDAAAVTDFLTAYGALTQTSVTSLRQAIQIYMPFLLLRALSWCGMLVATYDQKPIQNVEILHKCQQFLQVDFAKPLLQKYGVTL